jgi:hypothetical protein
LYCVPVHLYCPPYACGVRLHTTLYTRIYVRLYAGTLGLYYQNPPNSPRSLPVTTDKDLGESGGIWTDDSVYSRSTRVKELLYWYDCTFVHLNRTEIASTATIIAATTPLHNQFLHCSVTNVD